MDWKEVWCWQEAKYICPLEPDRAPLEAALQKFKSGEWEYVPFGRGGDSNKNRIPETDCKYLVDWGLEAAGFHPTMEGGILNALLIVFGLKNADEYFCEIDCASAGPGDLVYFVVIDRVEKKAIASHVAFVSDWVKEEHNASCTGVMFEATRCPTPYAPNPGPKTGREWNSEVPYSCIDGGKIYDLQFWKVLRNFSITPGKRNEPECGQYRSSLIPWRVRGAV